MEPVIATIVSLVLAYFIGAIPFGFLIASKVCGFDIRDKGSGNIGATNVFRFCGWKLGILVLLLDALKGVAAVLLARWLGATELWRSIDVVAGLVAICGHNWTVFLGFKGGKGVATSTGVFATLAPFAFLIALAVFIGTVALTRYVALGSIFAAVALVTTLVAQVLLPGGQQPEPLLLAVAILAAAFIVIRHRTNLARLRAGTESKIRFSRTPEA